MRNEREIDIRKYTQIALGEAQVLDMHQGDVLKLYHGFSLEQIMRYQGITAMAGQILDGRIIGSFHTHVVPIRHVLQLPEGPATISKYIKGPTASMFPAHRADIAEAFRDVSEELRIIIRNPYIELTTINAKIYREILWITDVCASVRMATAYKPSLLARTTSLFVE